MEARRESDRAARAARIAQARAVAPQCVVNYEGDQEGSILAAVEAVEITRRADGIVVPEAGEALAIALDVPVDDDAHVRGRRARARSTPTASSERLLELARAPVQRPMTDEECRFYLHLEACPRATVPDVVR